MRFVVFSDVHLHYWRHVSVARQVLALYDVLDYCKVQGIETLLFCGDFFHTHGNLKTELVHHFHRWLEAVAENNLRLLAIAGNHDFGDRSGSANGLWAINLLPKGGLLSQATFPVVQVDDLPICGVTYMEDQDDLRDRLASVPSDSVLLLHQGVSGVELNSKGFTLNEILTPDMIPDRVLHAFSGHYHTTKYVSHNLTIPGALIQHTWQDAPDARGFLDVKVDGQRVHLRHVPSKFGDNFRVMSYEEYLRAPEDQRHSRNLKVVGVPDEATAAGIEVGDRPSMGRTIVAEVRERTAAIPEDFAESSLSSRALFEQYIATRGLSDVYIETGKRIVEGKNP